MISFRFFLGLCAVASLPGLRAQEAQVIIEAAAKAYAEAPAFSTEVDSRKVHLFFPPAPAADSPRYVARSTEYRRLQFRVRRPQDYWLATQIYRDGPSGPAGFTGNRHQIAPDLPPGSWVLLAQLEGQASQGTYVGGKFMVQNMPSEQFTELAKARSEADLDVVLRHFHPAGEKPLSAAPLGLVEPEFIGRESLNGLPTYRLSAKNTMGHPVILWIDTRTSLVLRTVVQRGMMDARPGADGAPRNLAGMVELVETYYINQRIAPTFISSNFKIGAPLPSERLSATELGFSSIDDLVKLAEVTPPKHDASDVAATADSDPVPPAAATPPPVQKALEGQALTYDQMSGIVLVDGDGGTATGFMTKIRDVDFVVTNLHVLIGNKKLTLKTLRGEELPIQGIFGAIGGDIAIIRIAKGEGNLRLASDVFQSSKIGDKVVVVGNRRGGGVATQTGGSIKGIGPRLVEVDADFQSGNSGSPIVNLGTNEVIGVATYSETREVEVENTPDRSPRIRGQPPAPEVEKRWFGYRIDSVSKWEAIDLPRWHAQSERINKFRETSEALVAVIRFDFNRARQHPRLTSIIDNLKAVIGRRAVTASVRRRK